MLRTGSAQPDMHIRFTNVTSEKIRECFVKVMQRYGPLHRYEITLKQKPIRSATMQAQPMFSFRSLFKGVKHYQIRLALYVRDSKEPVANLPEDVLTGWFAHELGHVMDYEPYTNFEMILYGLKYLISDTFKRKAEHAADYIAIAHGFKEEILASKHYLLENELVNETYKAKIRKYYLPIETVELCTEKDFPMVPAPEL